MNVMNTRWRFRVFAVFITTYLKESSVSTVKNAESVDTGINCEVWPRFSIDKNRITEILWAPTRVDGGIVPNVGEVDGAIRPELHVPNHQRNLILATGKTQRGYRSVERWSHKVETHQTRKHIEARDAVGMVVVPEHGRRLRVGVLVVLCNELWACFIERSKPSIRVTIVNALHLGAMHVDNSWHATVDGISPVYSGVDCEKVLSVRDVILPTYQRCFKLRRNKSRTWVLCSGLACSVCVQCRCIQILMQLLENRERNNFYISLFPDTATHYMISKHLPASPMKLKRICYKTFFARIVYAHLPTDQPILSAIPRRATSLSVIFPQSYSSTI